MEGPESETDQKQRWQLCGQPRTQAEGHDRAAARALDGRQRLQLPWTQWSASSAFPACPGVLLPWGPWKGAWTFWAALQVLDGSLGHVLATPFSVCQGLGAAEFSAGLGGFLVGAEVTTTRCPCQAGGAVMGSGVAHWKKVSQAMNASHVRCFSFPSLLFSVLGLELRPFALSYILSLPPFKMSYFVGPSMFLGFSGWAGTWKPLASASQR